VPAAALVQESSRRANELPGALNYVGGAEARYQKSTTALNLSGANENIQWLVQTLWNAIDGYMTVDKIGQRVGADTYTVVQGIREMLNRGIISLLRKASPFPCSGTLGSPLTSHTDFDINPGDALMSFYLDPLSGAPVWQKGEFSGVSSVLQPKNLLHTVPILPGAKGALILKNYKLIGVHNGNVVAKPGQTLPPGAVAQMMFMSAMLDMSVRKMRGATDGDETGEGRIASLRTRAEEQAAVAPGDKIERIICPTCHAINAEYGPCSNCGGAIVEEVEQEPTGKLAKLLPMKQLKLLQKKSGLTDKQVMLGGAFAVGFPLFALMFCMPPPPPQAPLEAPEAKFEHHSSSEAVRLGVSVGFKGLAPPEYWYEDTSKITAPARSFGLYSDTNDQKLLFVIFDDMSAVQNFENFLVKPPFVKLSEVAPIQKVRADDGSQTFGYGSLKWMAGNYLVETTAGNDTGVQKMLIAAFQAKNQTQSVLVIGRPLKDKPVYDYKSALWLIDQMGEDFTKDENEKKIGSAPGITNTSVKSAAKKPAAGDEDDEDKEKKPAGKVATADDIKKFLDSAQKQITAKYVLPDGMAQDVKDPKSKRLHVNLTIAIDNDGKVIKEDMTDPSGLDKVDNSVLNAVKAAAPFKGAPQTDSNSLSLLIKLRRDKIKVSQPE